MSRNRPEKVPKCFKIGVNRAMLRMRTLGPFRLDTEAGILFRGAEPVALGSRAVALLRVLTERPGVPVSKDALIEAAWSGNVVEESNLTVQIAALRRALGEEPGAERWIETLPRRGYRFVGPIVETEGHAENHRSGVERGDSRDERDPGRRQAADAERRQLTVMCCEPVGAAVRPSAMDLDDLREVISAYHTCIASTVARFGGFIDRYLGNTVLVYFGYPTAREDDADRAVRAGLELCAAMAALQSSIDVDLRCRVGIATGLVIVGDLGALGDVQEPGIVGDAPNIAKQLQALGQPGTVVVEQTTKRLVGNLFDYRCLATAKTTGADRPAQAWQVVGATTIESRFEALRTAPLTPLVGREEELKLLQRRWRQAAQGEGQLVLIAGEAGIGKSRLGAALLECQATEAHGQIRYFGSPHHQDSALYPVISHLARIADFARDDAPERKLDKLVAVLFSDGLAEGDVSLIAELLSLHGSERYPPLELSPQRKKERTQAALLRQLESFARRRPLLIIFEDLHWIDQTSRELLDLLAEQIDRLPMLLVATSRPEFNPTWTSLPQATLVALNRLTRSDGAALARQLVGTDQPLPDEVVNEIVRRADGVPLFVEELTKAVVEARIDQKQEAITSARGPSLVIPATLHASLMARLDRLGSLTKQVAQAGAALGREFSYELLASAGQLPEPHLQSALQDLVEVGLVFQCRAPPYGRFLFKHALVQDVAYSTLLRPARRELHGKIANALEAHFPERAASEPDLLAYHFAQAGVPGKAAGYYLLAGQLATRRSALVEAIRHLEHGLRVLEKAPRSPERLHQELDLYLALATARSSAIGYAAREVMDAYKQARRLCEELGDAKRLYAVLAGQWLYQFTRVERGAALHTAEEFLQLAGDRGNREASLLVGMSLYQLGKLEPAESFVRQALSPGKSIDQRPLAVKAIQDGRVSALMFHSMLLCLLGYLDQADAPKREALERARSLSHPYTLAFALAFACKAHWFYDEAMVPVAQAAELATLSAEQGYSLFLPVGSFHLGRAMIRNGRAPQGIAEMEKGIASYRATGANWTMPYHLGVLAFSYGESAQPEQGLRVIEEALGQAQRTQERWFEPELHRIKGELCARLSREGEAEIAFKRAARVAQAQRARLCELRARISHARLLVKQGQQEDARDLLAPVYASFSEGLETRQLKEAAALVDEPSKGARGATGAG
jgi:class 3 adenylate cyclase/predicted ATPase